MTYIVGHPIKSPSDFYGRLQQITRFFAIIGGTQAQSLSILGLRRAGKTSFLQHVANRSVMAQYLPNADDYVMVYIDMSTCKSPPDFYLRLLKRLRLILGKGRTGFLWKESPPDETNLYDVETYLCQFPDRRIVLLLDEFDQLRTDAFGQDFLTELRAMTSVFDYDMACVTASYWDLYYLGNRVGLPPTSPFYNIFYPTPIFLSGLETAESENLIAQPAAQMGTAFSPREIRVIRSLAGTLPFFLQATAAKWFQYRHSKQFPDPKTIVRQLANDLAPYFDQWWRHFGEKERYLLQQVAAGLPLETLAYTPVELNDISQRLLRYGLLVENGRKYHVNGAVFTYWIRQYAELATQKHQTQPLNGKLSDPRALRHALNDYFNMDELRTLCFDLGMDFEALPGNNKPAKARELVEYCRNRHDLNRLAEAIRVERGAIV